MKQQLYDFVFEYKHQLLEHLQVVKDIMALNPRSERAQFELKQFVESYHMDDIIMGGIVMGPDLSKSDDPSQPDYDKIKKYLDDDFISFTFTMCFFYARYLGRDADCFSYSEFSFVKNLVETIMADSDSDQSIYTRLILYLKIPIDMVPKSVVRMLHKSDEFVTASNMVGDAVEKMNPISGYASSGAYREYTSSIATSLVSKMHDSGFFGTLEMDFLIEIMMCYKMGFFQIGPSYRVDREGYQFKYPDIEAMRNQTDSLWEARWRKE